MSRSLTLFKTPLSAWRRSVQPRGKKPPRVHEASVLGFRGWNWARCVAVTQTLGSQPSMRRRDGLSKLDLNTDLFAITASLSLIAVWERPGRVANSAMTKTTEHVKRKLIEPALKTWNAQPSKQMEIILMRHEMWFLIFGSCMDAKSTDVNRIHDLNRLKKDDVECFVSQTEKYYLIMSSFEKSTVFETNLRALNT